MQQPIRQYMPNNEGRAGHGQPNIDPSANDPLTTSDPDAALTNQLPESSTDELNLGTTTADVVFVHTDAMPVPSGDTDPTTDVRLSDEPIGIDLTENDLTFAGDPTLVANDPAEPAMAALDAPTGDAVLAGTLAQQPATTAQHAGKTALITGASSGIGRELALVFAQNGYKLVLVARSEDTLQQLADQLRQQYGTQATVVRQDLADPAAPAQVYAETGRQGLTIDVLVNNAGVGEYGQFATESDLQKELALIQLNSVSLVQLTKLYLKDMINQNDGKILLLGSVASVMPHPLMAVYAATKSFNYTFGEALRNELKDTGITVTVLMPTTTNTDFFNKAGAEHTVARQMARSVSATDVAKAAYEGLMAGQDKVVPGLMAKLQVASAHVLPDAAVTQYMRTMLKDWNEFRRSMRPVATAALAVGAAVLGGWWLLSRSRATNGATTYRAGRSRSSEPLATNVVDKATALVQHTTDNVGQTLTAQMD